MAATAKAMAHAPIATTNEKKVATNEMTIPIKDPPTAKSTGENIIAKTTKRMVVDESDCPVPAYGRTSGHL